MVSPWLRKDIFKQWKQIQTLSLFLCLFLEKITKPSHISKEYGSTALPVVSQAPDIFSRSEALHANTCLSIHVLLLRQWGKKSGLNPCRHIIA